MADGSALVGTAVVGSALVGSLGETPPEFVRAGGGCWKLVTDPAAVAAAQAAAQAQQEARDAFALAKFAPRIADAPPTLSDAAGKAPGAGWLEYDPATQLLKAMWRWDGEAWLALPMDPVMVPVIQIGTGTAGDLTADRVVVTGDFVARVAQILQLDVQNLIVTEGATINELVAQAFAAATADIQQAYIQNLRTNGAVIDEAVIGDLAANIITSGLFRTAAEGQRWEIDSNGIVMFGLDPDGLEYEVVRIGPSGDNLLTIGDSTVSPTGVVSPEADFEVLRVGGQDLSSEVLAQFPRGVVGFAYEISTSAWDGTGDEIVRLQAEAPLLPNRRYSITVDQHFIRTRTAGATTFVEFIRWDTTGRVYPSSTELTAQRAFLASSTGTQTMPGMVGWIDTDENIFGTAEKLGRFALCTRSAGGRDIRIEGNANEPVRITIRDEGPTVQSTGKSWFYWGTAAEGSTEAPPEKPEVKRYTKTYTSTGYRCYDADGSSAGTPDVVQGLYSGGPSRLRRRGGWTFPSMTGDLSGATIEKVEAYVYCDHTWSSAGSTVNIATWNDPMQDNLSVAKSVSGWKAGSGRWVTLPSSTHSGFRSGANKGIGVVSTSSSASQYARLRGSGAKIRITYRK